MTRTIHYTVMGKCYDWLKERFKDPNTYWALGGVAAFALIELVVFA